MSERARRSDSIIARKSSGASRSNDMRCPVRGCTNPRTRAVRGRLIDALDVVRAELYLQDALRVQGAREHHQAARVLVEPVNHADSRLEAASAHSPQQGPRAVGERVFVARLVGDAQQSG